MTTARRIAKNSLVLPSQAQAPGLRPERAFGSPGECLKTPAAYEGEYEGQAGEQGRAREASDMRGREQFSAPHIYHYPNINPLAPA